MPAGTRRFQCFWVSETQDPPSPTISSTTDNLLLNAIRATLGFILKKGSKAPSTSSEPNYAFNLSLGTSEGQKKPSSHSPGARSSILVVILPLLWERRRWEHCSLADVFHSRQTPSCSLCASSRTLIRRMPRRVDNNGLSTCGQTKFILMCQREERASLARATITLPSGTCEGIASTVVAGVMLHTRPTVGGVVPFSLKGGRCRLHRKTLATANVFKRAI